MPMRPTITSPTSRRTAAASSSAATTASAFELWRLDLESGSDRALTANGGVNLEPRISPDGRQIAFVSTAGTGHFNLKIADITAAGLANERYLVAPRESRIDRYYYSTHDHFINPSWSPDGKRVWYVTNAEIPWGTGRICSVAVDGRRNPNALTGTSSNRPGPRGRKSAPDGKRILFSNYHGGQWHQLWLTTTDDAAPLPLTYGEFDRRNARWSPDGKRIAYISNERRQHVRSTCRIFSAARGPKSCRSAPKRLRPACRGHAHDRGRRRAARSRRACRCSAAMAAGMRHANAGCTATSSTTARSFRAKSTTSTAHVALPASSCRQARRRSTSQNGFRRKPATIERELLGRRDDRAAGPRSRTTTCRADFGKFLERRPARAHELRRPLPQHARNAARAAGSGRPRRRLQPARQQGRADPGHRLLQAGRRRGSRERRSASCSMRRNSTRASGATWAS